MKHCMKRYLAAAMAAVMIVALVPAGTGGQVQASDINTADPAIEPALHYDMSYEKNSEDNSLSLTDVSGNGKNGTLHGYEEADLSGDAQAEGTLAFNGNSQYVDIPAGVITGEAFAIEAVYTTTEKSAAWLFTLGTTVAEWPNVKNYLFVSPYASDGSYNGDMLAAIKGNGDEIRYPASKKLTGHNDGTTDDTVTVVFDNGDVTYYLNGEPSEVTTSGLKIQDILAAHNNEECMGYIGKSLYAPDPYFKGTLKDFKIYDEPMTETLLNQAKEDAANRLKSLMMNKNSDENNVVSALSFPEVLNGISLTWEIGKSDDQEVVAADGSILWEGAEKAEINITVTGFYGEAEVLRESYTLKVVGKGQAEYDALELPNADNIRGNITLPGKGENGSPITWESSNEAVISTKETANSGYDKTPAGVVHRQDADTKVTLTATLKQAGGERKKEIEVTVKAKAKEEEKTDYLFAYFIGDGKESDGEKQEQIFFAASRDGLNWGELNESKPVLSSTMGEEGLRDPYILRSAEGDKFYLIATDLQIAKGGDNVWGNAQTKGSQAIMVWESEDLVNWSEQRMVTVSAGIDAGCTWAPEAFYDSQTGEYIVFWASKVKGKNYDRQRLYYCKTRDFYTFTKPKMWIEKDFSVIDTTVVQDEDGTYYRFTKNENDDGKYIFMEKSNTLLKGWKSVPSATLEAEKWREGPCCFKFSDEDAEAAGGKWAVLLDDFGGVGYYPMVTDDLLTAQYSKLTTAQLPKVKKPRHGTVLNITAEEYERVVKAYGAVPFLTPDSVPDQVGMGYTLPARAKINYAGELTEADMAWDQAKLDSAGKVTVTGTIGGTGKEELDGKTVSKEVEVLPASENTIYYIDSGVEDGKESGTYKAVGSLAELRNTVPDQQYEQGGWGIVNDSDNVGRRASEAADTVYKNGWYAKSGKNCEYIIPLENGTYTATGYFAEWWGVTRPMKFYVEYTKDDGTKVKSEEKDVSVSGSTSQRSETISFTVEGVADKAEVHFLSVKADDQDPVIAGLAIEKERTDDEKAKAEAAKVALEKVEMMSQGQFALQPEASENITLSYPEGYAEAAAAANYTPAVIYTSNNTRAAEVDENGKITAKAAGMAVITTRVALSSKLYKTFTTKVTVAGKEVEGVTLNKTSLTIKEKGRTARLKATVTPADAQNRTLTWSSSNEAVATVSSDGIVTAIADGEAVIKVTTANGKEASCTVTVGEPEIPGPTPVSGITLDKDKLTLKVGESGTLKATVLPAEADQTVSWTSDAEGTATVDNNGKVTAVKEGTAKITASAGGKTAVCNVTVGPKGTDPTPPAKKPVSKVSLNKTKLTLGVKEKFTLKASITPKDATEQKVVWTLSKKNIVSISSKGVVTAKRKGTVKITATVDGRQAVCTVTVKKAPNKVSLKKTKVTLKKGKTYKIKVKLPKKTASNKMTYASNKKSVATVSSKGVIKARKKGTAVITVKTFNKKKAKLTVTVK